MLPARIRLSGAPPGGVFDVELNSHLRQEAVSRFVHVGQQHVNAMMLLSCVGHIQLTKHVGATARTLRPWVSWSSTWPRSEVNQSRRSPVARPRTCVVLNALSPLWCYVAAARTLLGSVGSDACRRSPSAYIGEGDVVGSSGFEIAEPPRLA